MDKGIYGRRDRLVQERRHDVYRSREKWPEPTQCSKCGAVFVGGRWAWKPSVKAVNQAVCPACRRIADHYPAGLVEIKGSFFGMHRSDIENLIRNVERMENAEHPLERIMAITDEADYTVVTTTGIHLARRIGEALARAYKGDLTLHYGEGEQSVHLRWER